MRKNKTKITGGHPGSPTNLSSKNKVSIEYENFLKKAMTERLFVHGQEDHIVKNRGWWGPFPEVIKRLSILFQPQPNVLTLAILYNALLKSQNSASESLLFFKI